MPTREIIAALIFITGIAAVYALELFLIAVFAFRKLKGEKHRDILPRKAAVLVHVLATIGLICFFYGYFVEPYWIEVNVIPIQTDKLTRTTFRLVQISDIHCDRKPRNEQKIVRLINSLEPDVIVFTGDSLNTFEALARFRGTMTALKANLGKFAVRGNFEVWYWPHLDLFGATGFQLLEQSSVVLRKNGEEIRISGLSCEYPERYRGLLGGVPPNRFSVFLYHYSDLVEDLENLNVDLYLCGHTHGGQVALPFYGALITLSKFGKKYEAGRYNVENTILYVNRGLGLDGGFAPRVRFLARPEIAVFEIGPPKVPSR
ncbi:MAG: metallophosphoesterase [Planctomycetota bacterium]|jgi:predicted MPP superfamily phosphohydrolase